VAIRRRYVATAAGIGDQWPFDLAILFGDQPGFVRRRSQTGGAQPVLIDSDALRGDDGVLFP
jgi:hypothetical protein